MCCERVVNGRLYRASSAVPVRCMLIFSAGSRQDFFFVSGRQGWPNTMRWRASPGAGKASMGAWARHPWRNRVWAPIPRIGEKNGRKRSLLVDARGIPLSLVASRANVHDVKLLEATLRRIVCARPRSSGRTTGHKARRWVVERTHSWLNRFRKLLVSFEKIEQSFIALLSLAAAMICWRQTVTIYG